MKKINKVITVLMTLVFFVTSLSIDNVHAATNDNAEEYKYVMFAEDINLNAEHVSVNGECAGSHQETMIDKQRSVISKFIMNENGDEENKTYSDESIVLNELENFNFGCINNIKINQEVINTKSVLYSKNGNIDMDGTNINYSGLIYAPNGSINITGKNVNLNSILIANEININAENITVDKNEEMAIFLGKESDIYSETKDIYTYDYDVFNNITSINVGDSNLVNYYYKDSFEACLEKEEYANSTEYNYLVDIYEDSDHQGEDALNNYICDNIISNDIQTNQTNYELTADGNVQNIEDGQNESSYIYDQDNQLVRVNDKNLKKTFLYSYDEHGNIINKQQYQYTEDTPVNMISEDNYSYDSNWIDCLKCYNGESIETDEMGNPLVYNGWTFSWEKGNQLKTATNTLHDLTFEYDYFGLRMSKTDNGIKTSYKYIDRKIVEQDNGVDKLIFKYDEDFNIIGININGTDYFYEKNIQNDIVKIDDASGNVVVEYTYDPWGRIESITGELADTVGYLNPIRYRGYYYDNETEMYYLLSRYYDPSTCRFISIDNLWYLCCDNNLFKYCNNNPVNFIDENGHLSWNGGTPIINSAQDAQDYNALVTTAQNTLQTLGFTNITSTRAIGYLSATHEFSIRSLERRCQFLAQCAIESFWGLYTTELGDEAYFQDKSYPYKYRGSGYIQLTGSANYSAFANYIGDSNVYSQGADYVAEYYAWQASGWWWMENNINQLIDNGASVNDISMKVTGSKTLSYLDNNKKGAERRAAYKKIKKLL